MGKMEEMFRKFKTQRHNEIAEKIGEAPEEAITPARVMREDGVIIDPTAPTAELKQQIRKERPMDDNWRQAA